MTLKEIMTHQAGLPASITYYPTVMEPVNPDEKLFNRRYTSRYSIRLESRYWGNNQTRYKDDLLQSGSSDLFPYQVAENLFSSATCRDSLFRLIADAPMRRTKTYLYSDLGFIYLWKMAEKITEEPFEKYLEKKLYGPLGATTLGYLPLKKFPKAQIAPTENDRFFRRQLVQGTVHDQVASLMGGVSGHAGLFSTANDLAKLMQLYLNKGTYGGEKFFDPGTVALFTACQYCGTNHNRRGLGFDKPSSEGEDSTCEDCVSLSSFGHTGFTGTYTWADPETGLLYIFLSNRVHPDPTNQKLTTLRTRVKILEVLSQCITGGNHML
jgi:CubicO group peptidase (beta-lactamase class C family)